MTRTDVVVIGAGQAGLAASRLLTERSVEHVLLDRGDTANRWRSGGWDSLRLLTPNWMSRLPGWSYRGTDPAGFMRATQVVRYLTDYAASFAAPVVPGAEVVSVCRRLGRFLVVSTAGCWTAPAVVIATGACQEPVVPPLAEHLHPSIGQLTADAYRSPDDVADGGVLVVGASATGVQLADEIRSAGHDVVLSAGRHTRVPRRYRGRDIMSWLDALGALRKPLRPPRRHEPSLQLHGHPNRAVDLPALAGRGVRLAGRLRSVEGRTLHFADDLAVSTAQADARLARLLTRIDALAATADPVPAIGPADRPVAITGTGVRRADLGSIRTVVWATGYRRRYPWLHVPVLDADGEIRQTDGRTGVPGLFVVGLPNQTRRASTLIDGVGLDAGLVVDSLLSGRGEGRRAS